MSNKKNLEEVDKAFKQCEEAYDANVKDKGLEYVYIRNETVIGTGENLYRDYRDRPELKRSTTITVKKKKSI